MPDTLFDMTPQGTGAYGQAAQPPAPTGQIDYHTRNQVTAPHNGTATSIEAARSLSPQVLNDQQRQVLEAITALGEATDEDVEHRTGMKHQSASARRGELATIKRLIVSTGRTKKTSSGRPATLWRLRVESDTP